MVQTLGCITKYIQIEKIEIITSDQTYEQEGNSKIDMILHR